MAVKAVFKKGGAIVDTDCDYFGWATDETKGLYHLHNPDVTDSQKSIAYSSHKVTETNNPLWNQVDYTISDNIAFTSSGLDGHVTLIGIDQMGTETDIMQHRYSATENLTSVKKTFDLLSSACTGGVTKQVSGSATAGTVKVDLAKRYDKYESVQLMPAWFDQAWTKRKALQIIKTEGYLRGSKGHLGEYYGVTVGIPYSADMKSDLGDIRFCAPDGITVCPHYFIREDASKTAGNVCAAAIVLIPWHFVEYDQEVYKSITGTKVHEFPSYIYMYYGNSSATSTSDISLDSNTLLYTKFDQLSLDPKWTLYQDNVTNNYISYSTTGVTLGATTAIGTQTRVTITSPLGTRTDANKGFEMIIKVVNNTALTTTEGCIFRLHGVSSPTSYVEVRAYQGTPVDYGGGTSTRFAYSTTVSKAGSATTNYYQTAPAITSAAPVYFKFRFNPSTGTDYIATYTSYNGFEWDYLGKVKGFDTAWATADDLAFSIWYYGNTVSPQAGNVKVEQVIAYPIMSDNGAVIDDHFQDGYFVNRYTTGYANTYRTLTETGNQMLMQTTGTTVDTSHTIAMENSNWSPLMITSPVRSATAADNLTKNGCRIQYGQNLYSDVTFETEISALSAPTVSGDFNEAGVICNTAADLGQGSAGMAAGIRHTNTGGVRHLFITYWNAGTVSTWDLGSTWTAADLPIRVRIRQNHTTKKIAAEFKFEGTKGEWQTHDININVFNNTYLGSSIGTFGIYMRGAAAKAEARATYFNYMSMDSGGRILEDKPSNWRNEETYTVISPTTPQPEDMTINFASTSIANRNEPYYLVTKDYGGDYSYSKVFNLKDQDYISVGPDGVDKYIGMKLEFNFDFDSTDQFDVESISYIYEVI